MMMNKYKTEKEDLEGKMELIRPAVAKEKEIDYIKSTDAFIKCVKELNLDEELDMQLIRNIILHINVFSKSKRSGEKKEFEIHYCDNGIMEEFAYARIT